MIKEGKSYVSSPDKLQRTTAAMEDKSWSAKGIDIQRIIELVMAYDKYVGLELKLIHAFGLRREEAIQFRPHRADEGFYIRVRNGTKGGRERLVIIENDYQRQVLDEAKAFCRAPNGHTGWPDKDLQQSIRRFQYVLNQFGLTKDKLGVTAHRLRHQRLNDMFEEIAGVPASVRQLAQLKEGKPLENADPDLLLAARHKTTTAAGHARLSITTAYTGSNRSVKKAMRGLEWKERVANCLVPVNVGNGMSKENEGQNDG